LLDFTDMQKPGLSKNKSDRMDELEVANFDEYTWRQNAFIEYEEGEKRVILPIEFEASFFGALRRGIGSRHGPN
jgi:hypothetical protein